MVLDGIEAEASKKDSDLTDVSDRVLNPMDVEAEKDAVRILTLNLIPK